MVATAARKARRAAAALASAGAAAAAPAGVSATPEQGPSSSRRVLGGGGGSGRDAPPLVGVGNKRGGGYTPPAILRAVANAARNKEASRAPPPGGPGSGTEAPGASPGASSSRMLTKADWACPGCGTSNFAKRLACFKCKSPRPGRAFTAAGVKGYEKRRAKREAREAQNAAATETNAPKRPKAETTNARAAVKTVFDDADEEEASPTAKGAAATGTNANATRARRHAARDRGVAPKKLRDPDAPAAYLLAWTEAAAERAAKGLSVDQPGFKPANGWKVDKNVQNWLIANALDGDDADDSLGAPPVDDVTFEAFEAYAAGLRGGPRERLRERAAEANRGKGRRSERARRILRALANGGAPE